MPSDSKVLQIVLHLQPKRQGVTGMLFLRAHTRESASLPVNPWRLWQGLPLALGGLFFYALACAQFFP